MGEEIKGSSSGGPKKLLVEMRLHEMWGQREAGNLLSKGPGNKIQGGVTDGEDGVRHLAHCGVAC